MRQLHWHPQLLFVHLALCGCRAMEFMMAIMRRLLQKPEMSMSEVVYEQYHATLAQWHGFWASSAFNVSSRAVGVAGKRLQRASTTAAAVARQCAVCVWKLRQGVWLAVWSGRSQFRIRPSVRCLWGPRFRQKALLPWASLHTCLSVRTLLPLGVCPAGGVQLGAQPLCVHGESWGQR